MALATAASPPHTASVAGRRITATTDETGTAAGGNEATAGTVITLLAMTTVSVDVICPQWTDLPPAATTTGWDLPTSLMVPMLTRMSWNQSHHLLDQQVRALTA